MNTLNQDLFGEKRIHINGNPLLQDIANHILELVGKNPELLNGDKVGEIDRNIALELWYDEGLKQFIPEDKRQAFKEWFSNPKHCPDYEAISRARRLLAERDYIRLPKKAIEAAERDRQRISRSVK